MKKTGYRAFLFHPSFGTDPVRGEIYADDWGVRFHSDRVVEQIPVKQIQIELEDGGTRIFFRDPARRELKIFTTDKAILKNPALLASSQLRPQIREIKDRGRIARVLGIVLSLVVALALLVWLASLAGAALAGVVASGMPRDWTQRHGDALLESSRAQMTFVNDPRWEARLTALASPLARTVADETNAFTFHIVEDPAPNAFALPGGHIVVTTGLLQTAERPEELLGVIAHEMAHDTHRHGFRKIIAGEKSTAIWKMFFQRSQAETLVAKNSSLPVYQSFPQDYELEADDAGWRFLVEANIDPRGMIDMYRKLQGAGPKEKPSPAPQEFAGHPALETRIAQLQAKWERLSPKSGFIEITNGVPQRSEPERKRIIIIPPPGSTRK